MKYSNSSAYSFGTSKRNNSKSNFNPGPGYYTGEINITKRKSPGWKIGTSKRDSSFYSEMPGPGQYSSNTALGKAPKYSFGIRNEKSKEHSSFRDIPGPGNYNPDFNKKYKNVSYSILGRKDLYKTEPLPGPGQYSVSEKLNNSAYKFGTEKKGAYVSENSKILPGPGQYLSNQNFVAKTPLYSFGKNKRKLSETRPWTPGPGQYAHSQKLGSEGPKYSVGKSSRPFSSNRRENTLGPGAYSTNFYNKPQGPRTVMGKSSRDNFYSNEIPGPGMYIPNLNMKGVKTPAFSMGKSQRDGNKSFSENTLPGPGNYNTNSFIGNGPKYSFLGRHDKERPENQPGPGYYNTEIDCSVIRPKSPSWRMGTAKRSDNNENYVPGPGMYESKTGRPNSGYRYQKNENRFGNEKKNVIKTNENPGPGQYKIPYSIGEVPGYSNGAFSKEYKFI